MKLWISKEDRALLIRALKQASDEASTASVRAMKAGANMQEVRAKGDEARRLKHLGEGFGMCTVIEIEAQ